MAILDRQLGSTDTFAVADRLQALGVPFLFLAGNVRFDRWGGHEAVPGSRSRCGPKRC